MIRVRFMPLTARSVQAPRDGRPQKTPLGAPQASSKSFLIWPMLTPNWRAMTLGLTPASRAARIAFTFDVGRGDGPELAADPGGTFSRAPGFGGALSGNADRVSPRRWASAPRAERRSSRPPSGSRSRPASSLTATAAGSSTTATSDGFAASTGTGSDAPSSVLRVAANPKRSGPSVFPFFDDRGFAMLLIMAHLDLPGKPVEFTPKAHRGHKAPDTRA
jgi:hypothetical protein